MPVTHPRAKIHNFAEQTGLIERTYNRTLAVSGRGLPFLRLLEPRTMLLLDLPSAAELPPERVNAYLLQHERARQGQSGIDGTCFAVARRAVRAGMAPHRMYTQESVERALVFGAEPPANDGLTRFLNHCVNADELPDGTFVAVDLTAATSVDGQSNTQSSDPSEQRLDVLAVRATSLDELRVAVAGLYNIPNGQEWQIDQAPPADRTTRGLDTLNKALDVVLNISVVPQER